MISAWYDCQLPTHNPPAPVPDPVPYPFGTGRVQKKSTAHVVPGETVPDITPGTGIDGTMFCELLPVNV